MARIFKKIINNRYTVIFILFISLPVLFKLTGTGRSSSIRERKAKTLNVFSDKGLVKGLKEYEKYFEKNFPFRKDLLFKRNYLYAKYLGVSPVDRVILGKNKWLFLKRLNESGAEIDYSVSIEKFKKGELEYWFHLFQERYQFLKKKGIYLLLVIVPNKSTIYSEHLPDSIRKVTGGVRADQITRYFRNNSDIPVLNLRELLLKNKKIKQIYHRTDSHWTLYGAWLAYKEIIDHLSHIYKDVTPHGYESFPKKNIKGLSRADLASMLALQRSLYGEKFERIFFPRDIRPEQIPLKNFKFKKIRTSYFRCEQGVLPKTIMIHDSFGLILKKYMSTSFSEIIFLMDWGFNFFPELIEKENPSIVIYEIAERFFYRPVPSLPESKIVKGK